MPVRGEYQKGQEHLHLLWWQIRVTTSPDKYDAHQKMMIMMMMMIIIIIIIIIIIMFIDCKWVDTRRQWSFNMLHMHGLWRLII